MSENTFSRRRAIALAGVGVAGVTGAAAIGGAMVREDSAPLPEKAEISDAVAFYGAVQGGIVTPAQDRLHFTAFDVLTKARGRLVQMLQEWTAAAARMTAGKDAGEVGATAGILEAPPDDTGEAIGLPASGLTLTI